MNQPEGRSAGLLTRSGSERRTPFEYPTPSLRSCPLRLGRAAVRFMGSHLCHSDLLTAHEPPLPRHSPFCTLHSAFCTSPKGCLGIAKVRLMGIVGPRRMHIAAMASAPTLC